VAYLNRWRETKNGSVQESDRARDFSEVGFTPEKCAVAVVAVGMSQSSVWCGFPSSVDGRQLFGKDSAIIVAGWLV